MLDPAPMSKWYLRTLFFDFKIEYIIIKFSQILLKETVYEKLKASPFLDVYYKEEVPEELRYNQDSNIGNWIISCIFFAIISTGKDWIWTQNKYKTIKLPFKNCLNSKAKKTELWLFFLAALSFNLLLLSVSF